MHPVIGITTYGRYEKIVPSEHYPEHYTLPAAYVDAVRRAGGIPVLLPPGDANLRELLEQLDGVIVAGGADVHPSHYGGDPDHPQLSPQMDPERDATELELARYVATNKDEPALFICRGMQTINVALGGTLHEHIPDVRAEDIHRSAEGGWIVQPVAAEPGSRLADVMGQARVATYSGHHQAVDRVAPALQVTATAPDGLVEALGMSDHPWLIAVQWHPEMSAAHDATQQRIFDDLVRAAAARREKCGAPVV